MGLFDKLRKKPEENTPAFLAGIDKSDWLSVFSACLGRMLLIQNRAAGAVVKDREWNVDFRQGTIAFGEDKYPLQLIGSESYVNETWMWGWNNINHLQERLIELAKASQRRGKEWKLEALTSQQFCLDNVYNGHTLSMVSCTLSEKPCFYYRCPHDSGAVYVAVSGAPKEVFAPADRDSFAQLTVDAVGQFRVDHKIFAESFLKWNGTAFDWDGDTLIAHFSPDLYLGFGENGGKYCIKSIKSQG